MSGITIAEFERKLSQNPDIKVTSPSMEMKSSRTKADLECYFGIDMETSQDGQTNDEKDSDALRFKRYVLYQYSQSKSSVFESKDFL